MRKKIVSGIGLLLCSTCTLFAAENQQVSALDLHGQPMTTQAQRHTTFGPVLCDESGSTYLRYTPQEGSAFSAGITRIDSKGAVTTIPIGALPELKGTKYLFAFAVGSDGSLYEILRSAHDEKGNPAKVYYAHFAKDGTTLITKAAFDIDYVPYALVPLPTGDFFAAGVLMKHQDTKVQREPLAGIFSSNARLKRALPNEGLVPTSEAERNQGLVDPAMQGGVARLGGDGSIYILLDTKPAKLRVVTPEGQALQELTLEGPFPNASPTSMVLSGNRMVVQYYREDNDPQNAFAVVAYDLRTGATERVYRPTFRGLFIGLEGDSVRVLMQQKSVGVLAIGTANLD